MGGSTEKKKCFSPSRRKAQRGGGREITWDWFPGVGGMVKDTGKDRYLQRKSS